MDIMKWNTKGMSHEEASRFANYQRVENIVLNEFVRYLEQELGFDLTNNVIKRRFEIYERQGLILPLSDDETKRYHALKVENGGKELFAM